MALTTTTLSAAVTVNDNQISVAAATGFTVGYLVLIDLEVLRVTSVSGTIIQVLRGQDGTATAAHPTGANATAGLATDFATPGPQADTTYVERGKVRVITSYSLTGALTLPAAGTDHVAVLNGTTVRAMTLAVPTKEMDGTILTIIGNGKAAHTVTAAGGFGAGSTGYTIFTFAAGAQNSICLMAMNGAWVTWPSLIGGTATALTTTIS